MSDLNDQTKRLFEKENRIYKYYLNSMYNDRGSVDFIQSLLKLELINMDKSEKQDLVQLYDILGFDKFFEVMTLFSSRTIKVPKIDKIKKLLIVSIAYYQVIVLGLSPKDASKILSEKLGLFNLKQKNMKALINRVQQDIDHLAEVVANKRQREDIEKVKSVFDDIQFKEK